MLFGQSFKNTIKNRTASKLAVVLDLSHVARNYLVISLSKEERDAPNTCKRHRGVDNTRQKCGRATANPRYYVKLKKSDRTPVERANDSQNQRKFINNHKNLQYKYINIFNAENSARPYFLQKNKKYPHF
jgi:hypothetical protein